MSSKRRTHLPYNTASHAEDWILIDTAAAINKIFILTSDGSSQIYLHQRMSRGKCCGRFRNLTIMRSLTVNVVRLCFRKYFAHVNVKVKQSHYGPGQALTVPGGWGSQISRQSALQGAKVVSPTHRPPLPSGNIPGTHFCQRLSRSQGHSAAGSITSIKNSNYIIGNRTRDLPACSAVRVNVNDIKIVTAKFREGFHRMFVLLHHT